MMKKTGLILLFLACFASAPLCAQDADGSALWIDLGMGYGGPDVAGLLVEQSLGLQLMMGEFGLAASLSLDWRLLDGLALPLQVGVGMGIGDDGAFKHYLFAMAGWDPLTGQFCWQLQWRLVGGISGYGLLGWDRGLRLLAGFSYPLGS